MGLKEENANLKDQVAGLNKRVDSLLAQLAGLTAKLDQFLVPNAINGGMGNSTHVAMGPTSVPATKLAVKRKTAGVSPSVKATSFSVSSSSQSATSSAPIFPDAVDG